MVSLQGIFALYHWQLIVRELFYPYRVSLLGIIFGKQFQLIESCNYRNCKLYTQHTERL